MRRLLASALRGEGCHVTECLHGADLLNRIDSFLFAEEPEHFDLLISDICMPGISGLSILEGFCRCDGFPPVVLITAFGDAETHAAASRFGAAAMLDKPFEIEELLDLVYRILPESGRDSQR